ncbi:hypothetical protein ACMT1E_01740 [Sphingomonas flavalba]|uniref:hypothetical protein n=1 Tax=Sphingomonas flavalba TaxID=2559804 RepID=UPI0039E15D5F
MQRVRVGLTGLAVVLLIAAATAAILQSANSDESAANGNAAIAAAVPGGAGNVVDAPREPLAEIGVAPGAGMTDVEKAAEATNSDRKLAPPANAPGR